MWMVVVEVRQGTLWIAGRSWTRTTRRQGGRGGRGGRGGEEEDEEEDEEDEAGGGEGNVVRVCGSSRS